MEHTTSLGPEAPRPDDKHEGRARTESVDAQAASELDLRCGRAGAEAKPFSPAVRGAPTAAPSPDVCDTAAKGPKNEALVPDRRTPGRDDGVKSLPADANDSAD